MQSLCHSARIDPDHWDACIADAVVIAGDLIPGLLTDSLTHDDIRRAVTGLHQCHVMALALQLAHEFASRGLTRNGVREYMLAADIARLST